jgi:hypothetical protein
MNKKLLLLSGALFASASLTGLAQTYPTKPMRLAAYAKVTLD